MFAGVLQLFNLCYFFMLYSVSLSRQQNRRPQGFDDGVSTVWDSMGMHQVIKDLCGDAKKDRKLYIAGHSLGAALATVTASRLAFEDDLDIAAVYTIGSPKYAPLFRCTVRMIHRQQYSRCVIHL